MIDVRLFLYRFFSIRCIVSLPRNIFIDTPTLTSLVFAQKKTAAQVEVWDKAWQKATKKVEGHIKAATTALRKGFAGANSGPAVAEQFLKKMSPVITERDWVSKGGKSPALLRIKKDWSECAGEDVAAYYREVIRTAGFRDMCRRHAFAHVTAELDYKFPVFLTTEIGYKLSKRREKARPNQLSLFRGRATKSLITNLHLAEEEYDVVIDEISPETVLDYVQTAVVWE